MFDVRRAGMRAFDVKGATILSCAVVGTLWFVVAQTFHAPQPVSVPAAVAARFPEPSRLAGPAQSGDGGGSGAAAGTAVVSQAESQTSGLTFHGYACTIDCSGHRAGFAWAQDEGIKRPDQCPAAPVNLRSLTEGCWAEAGREGP